MHLAGPLGMGKDAAYEAAYWSAFQEFFGAKNAEVVKSMLLAKFEEGDTGDGELDRVCFGLRQSMAWLAEAIERRALKSIGRKVPLKTP